MGSTVGSSLPQEESPLLPLPPALSGSGAAGAHPSLHLSQANLVAAFEQSLVSMTSRLRHLAETAEEKVGGSSGGRSCGCSASSAPWRCAPQLLALLLQDTELLDLRETIDFLKKKNSEAQAVIQGALNGTDVAPKGKAWWSAATRGL